MRVSKRFLDVTIVAAALAGLAASNCGGDDSSTSAGGATGEGGATGSGGASSSVTVSSTTSSTHSSTVATTTSSTSSAGGAGGAGTGGSGTGGGGGSIPCPGPDCTAGLGCINLADNTGLTTFGLRIAELDLQKPAALATGLFNNVLTSSVTPKLATCNLNGNATFNWLLQFDTTASTIKTGGAKVAADPTAGYAFDDETVGGLHIQPVVLPATIAAGGAFDASTGGDLLLPVFVDSSSPPIVLPLRKLRFTMGALSADQSCVGSYNASGLDLGDMCAASSTEPTFFTGASVDAHITLEDADQVIISVIQQSLCVLLTGDSGTFGDGGTPIRCKRTNGVIDFQGDWCDATDAAAGGGCADSVQLAGDFAASGVIITN